MDEKPESPVPVFNRDLTDAVDAWFFETFHNRGLSTDEFNRLALATSVLKERLSALWGKE